MENIFKYFKKRPIVFIGSGISKRYMDTPTWKELLIQTIKEYSSNPAHFGQIMFNNNYDLEKVASVVEKEYNDYFFSYVVTNTNHKEHSLYLKYKHNIDLGLANPYKLYTSKIFISAKENATFKTEKNLFSEMLNKCSNIITTNYDTLIEDNTQFRKVVGNKAFIKDQCIGFGEVYKIHGCCTEPNSIIITQDDYNTFEKNKDFFYSKLLISFVERPIIFLGYSISDKYIQNILENISLHLDDEEANMLAKRLVFVEYFENYNEIDFYIKQISNINMFCIKTSNFLKVYQLICENVNVGIPLELVRMFQEAVKNFVYEQNNPNALSVVGIDEIKDVRGLTAFHIGKPKTESDRKSIIKSADLIKDILFDNLKMESEDVLQIVMRENVIFPRSSYTPLYKYLKSTNEYKIELLTSKKFDSIENMYKQCEITESRILKTENDVEKAINETNKIYEKLSFIQTNLKVISTQKLRELLICIYNSNPNILNSKSSDKTTYRKLVCMLDYLENGQK